MARILSEVVSERGAPRTIRVDSGHEFTSKALDLWACAQQVELDFSRPGKPTDDVLIESFNGRFRQGCLHQAWFLSIEEARAKIDAWRLDYINHRPYSALGNLAPRESAVLSQEENSSKSRKTLAMIGLRTG